jgi:isoquinoline 1-oxidoreductase beta subunit
MATQWTFSRRNFLVKSGIGIGLALGLGIIGKSFVRRKFAEQADKGVLRTFSTNDEPTLWFEILANNQLTIYSPKVEMGQGIFMALAQIVAEELDADIQHIQVVNSTTKRGPNDPNTTGGSDSVSSMYMALRTLAANMREMIKLQAAKIWNVSPDSLITQNSIVSYQTKKLTYGEIVAQTPTWIIPDTEPVLKKNTDFKIIGKALPRVDLIAKIKAEPIFGIDASFPNMLFATVLRPPQFDVTIVSIDTTLAEHSTGVKKVFVEKDFVGIVALSRYQALEAKQKLKVTWTQPEKPVQQQDILATVQVGKGTPTLIQSSGDTESFWQDTDIYTAEYHSPMGAHAQMEPNGATAWYQDGKVTLKMSTQSVLLTRSEVAKATGIAEEDIDIQPTFLGGGFGRRLYTPHAAEAVILSRAVEQPVQVLFEREEEFQNSYLRPPTHHVLKAKLQNGRIIALEHNTSSGDVAFGSSLVPSFAAPILGADFGAWRGGMLQYERIPNFQTISWRCQLPFATSWWRGLGLLANSFAIESFIDELAFKSHIDPIAFRIAHIADDERGTRLKGVLKAVEKMAEWKNPLLPQGHALGIACSTDVNTPVAQVVEIKLENEQIKVVKVYCAIDAGLVINPDGIKAQCEGAIMMGLSASMYEEIQIENSKVMPNQYLSYQMAQLKDAPEIIIEIVSTGDTPRGVGEPPIGPIGAAIANAVAKLTGIRLNRMPLQKEYNRIKQTRS